MRPPEITGGPGALRLGVVVGLAAERKVLGERLRGAVVIQARGAHRAADAAQRLCDGGAQALLSFGIAGAVSPLLRRGDLLVPARVLWRGRVFVTDQDLRGSFLDHHRHGAAANGGPHGGVDGVLGDVHAKHRWHQATGAMAVDEESGALAEVAEERGVAMLVIRAVADTAAQSLPPEVTHWTDARGHTRYGRLMLDLLRKPALASALPALAGGFSSALKTLDGATASLASSTVARGC